MDHIPHSNNMDLSVVSLFYEEFKWWLHAQAPEPDCLSINLTSATCSVIWAR